MFNMDRVSVSGNEKNSGDQVDNNANVLNTVHLR